MCVNQPLLKLIPPIVRAPGFEPGTYRVSVDCSSQLSYARTMGTKFNFKNELDTYQSTLQITHMTIAEKQEKENKKMTSKNSPKKIWYGCFLIYRSLFCSVHLSFQVSDCLRTDNHCPP